VRVQQKRLFFPARSRFSRFSKKNTEKTGCFPNLLLCRACILVDINTGSSYKKGYRSGETQHPFAIIIVRRTGKIMEMPKKERQFEPKAQDTVATTTLGPDTEFTGNLKFGQTLKVEGKFEGDLSSDGTIIVAATGKVKADVKVGSAIIEGKVSGNVLAEELVELRSKAELFGDIKSKRLKIDDGVLFVGHCEVKPKGSETESPEMARPSAKPAATPDLLKTSLPKENK